MGIPHRTLNHVFPKAGVISVECCGGNFSVGDEYVIVGHTTGAVSGTVTEFRVETDAGDQSPTSVQRGTTFTMPHTGDARTGDQIYVLAPVTVKA